MAEQAGSKALAASGVAPADVDLVLVATCTMPTPSRPPRRSWPPAGHPRARRLRRQLRLLRVRLRPQRRVGRGADRPGPQRAGRRLRAVLRLARHDRPQHLHHPRRRRRRRRRRPVRRVGHRPGRVGQRRRAVRHRRHRRADAASSGRRARPSTAGPPARWRRSRSRPARRAGVAPERHRRLRPAPGQPAHHRRDRPPHRRAQRDRRPRHRHLGQHLGGDHPARALAHGRGAARSPPARPCCCSASAPAWRTPARSCSPRNVTAAGPPGPVGHRSKGTAPWPTDEIRAGARRDPQRGRRRRRPTTSADEKSFTDDLDVDSLSMVEVAMAAEEKFGVEDPRRRAAQAQDRRRRRQLHREARQVVTAAASQLLSGDDVVVTGLGATTPLGGDVATFWAGLLEGRSGVVALTEDWAADLPVRIAAPDGRRPGRACCRGSRRAGSTAASRPRSSPPARRGPTPVHRPLGRERPRPDPRRGRHRHRHRRRHQLLDQYDIMLRQGPGPRLAAAHPDEHAQRPGRLRRPRGRRPRRRAHHGQRLRVRRRGHRATGST